VLPQTKRTFAADHFVMLQNRLQREWVAAEWKAGADICIAVVVPDDVFRRLIAIKKLLVGVI
jgi:hypothetical protein